MKLGIAMLSLAGGVVAASIYALCAMGDPFADYGVTHCHADDSGYTCCTMGGSTAFQCFPPSTDAGAP